MTKSHLSKETIILIRERVLSGQTKIQVSRDLNVPYITILRNTKDIHIKIPDELVEKIRSKVKSGKSKLQVAEELDIPYYIVYSRTRDIHSKKCGWPGIRGGTLDLLQELVTKGYALSPRDGHNQQRCRMLRKYFPTIRRASVYQQQIFYLEGKENIAVRACLDTTKKKIISYQELKNVTKIFDVNLSKKEKEEFLFKKRGNGRSKNKGVLNEGSLRENDDSFSFFYIRRYCIF